MPRPIRRVVTGHNAQGRAIFISDSPAPAVFDRGPGATAVTELWETRATPASNAGNDDPTVGRRAAPAAAEERLEIPRRRVSAGFQAGRGAARAPRTTTQVRGLCPRPRQQAASRLPQDRHHRLRHRAVRRDLRADGRGRGAAQGRRRADPARHQPRLEQPHRAAVLHRLRADRRRAGVVRARRDGSPTVILEERLAKHGRESRKEGPATSFESAILRDAVLRHALLRMRCGERRSEMSLSRLRAAAFSSFASTSALRMRSISARSILTSGGRTTARGSLPISTSASFMRLCMSTQGCA